MEADDNRTRRQEEPGWREEGPEAITRGLQPTAGQDTGDESLWLALNAWG
jgi:hypothetical protein